VNSSQDKGARASEDESEKEFVSISKIDKMTEERKYRLFEMKQEHEKFQRDEEFFKKNNRYWPPSNHYIYLPHQKKTGSKSRRSSDEEEGDKLTDEWCQLNVFLPMLQEIIQPDHEKIKDILLDDKKGKLEAEFQQRHEQMSSKIEQQANFIKEDSEDDSVSKYSKADTKA